MRKYAAGVWGVVLAWTVLAGAQAAAKDSDDALTLIYSGNLDGELEPCGCSAEGNYGGILRRATMMDRLREQDSGVVLIETGGLVNAFAAHGRLAGEYILKGIAALDYDAIGVQWSDLTYGTPFATAASLPWVSSNWHDGVFAKERRVRRGAHELAFFSWLDPGAAPSREMQGDHNEVTDSTGPLAAALRKAHADGALTVLSTTLTLEQAQKRLPLADTDILFVRAAYEVYGEPRKAGRTLVLQPGSRGMRLGRLDLTLKSGAIAAWRHEVIPLPAGVQDSPRLQAWYKDYNAKVKEDYERTSAVRKAQQNGETPFAGETACKSCHAPAYEAWSKSRHAAAFDALENVNKAFDPGCIECHTVGFKQNGGFIDTDVTFDLRNVQCESCHGASREHATSGGAKPSANRRWSGPQMCAQCHTQPHSPAFKYEQYWPRIAH